MAAIAPIATIVLFLLTPFEACRFSFFGTHFGAFAAI
jgi:hypothetical protein